MEVALEIAIILVLILANGVFSLAEIAVVSVRKARLDAAAADGDHRAQAVLNLRESPGQFLSTVQVGITLVGTLAGAIGGATISDKLSYALTSRGWFGSYADELAFAVVVGVITYLSVVCGELVPKHIALAHAEGAAKMLAAPMRILARASAPLIWLLSKSSALVLALLRVYPTVEQEVTEDEIRIILEQGADAGVLERAEHSMVERVMEFADRRAASLMTPRTQVVWVDVNAPLEISLQAMTAAPHTFFLLCDGEIDHPLGMISAKELWRRQQAEGRITELRSSLVNVPHIPESMPALKLVEKFKQSGQHIAIVLDEYGGVSGLVTLHDLMESLVGEMPAADDAGEQSAVRRDDGSWLLDGMLPIADLVRLLEIDDPPADIGEFNTVAGLVLALLGHFPHVGERLEWAGVRLEIVDMDGYRIDRVLATPPMPPADAGGDARPK
jgi:putative hemolysin